MKQSTVSLLCAALVVAALGITSYAAEEGIHQTKARTVKTLKSWSGKLSDETLSKHAPAENFLVDQNKWKRLWAAWRGGEELPAIDFRKQMILVFTASGPNHVGVSPTLDAQGNIQAQAMSTLIGGPGFGYLILCIHREGVRSVNGKPLPGEKVPSKKKRSKNAPQGPGAASAGEPGVMPGSPGVSSSGDSGVVSSNDAGLVVSSSPDQSQVPPITQIENATPKRSVLDGATWMKPIVVKSETEAAKYFEADALARVTTQVDFGTQLLLLFAWRGSGQDRLNTMVAESYPEQVFFSVSPGRTRDLREHVRVFAIRSNVKWSVKGANQ